ncbi:MAG: heavy-metal-associated domain-containing protein [Limnohabitans sp.]
MQTVELKIQGMTCGGCVKHVTKALQSVPGVAHVDVDLVSGRARVEGELPSGVEPLISALAAEDYSATVMLDASSANTVKQGSGGEGKSGSQGGCCCH